MTPKPTPSPADRLRGDLASGIVKVVSSNDLFALIGPMRGLSAGTAEQRVSQLVREAWNKLPPACDEAAALLSDHARLVEEIGRLREALALADILVERIPQNGKLYMTIQHYWDARAALSPSQKEGGT